MSNLKWLLPVRPLLNVGYSENVVQSLRYAATLAQAKPVSEVPGPFCLPFVGSLWQFTPLIGRYNIHKMDLLAEDYCKRYGSIVHESFGSLRIVHLFEPEYFEQVIKATMNKPIRMGFLALGHYRDSHPDKYNSPGILPVNDERWWPLRQSFQKSVSPLKEAREFLSQTDEITQEFVNHFKPGEVVEDFMPYANRLNMELVCQLLFNERIHCFNEEALKPNSYWTKFIADVVEFAEGTGDQDRNLIMWKYLKGKSYKQMENTVLRMEEFSLKMIEKVKARGDPEDKCILAQFMRDPTIPEKELLAITIDLLLGGIHTTAITTCFMLYHVSQNPEIERKLKEEARRLLPPGAKITTNILKDAVYTRAVVKETFRVNPIAIGMGRTLTEDLDIAGYTIPKDTMVVLQSLACCRQEKFFKDACKFKPERWLKGSPEYEHVSPYLVIPFGLGLRSCLARRRAEQNLHVLTLRFYGRGGMEWMREKELGFTTPFMISPDAPVTLKFHEHH